MKQKGNKEKVKSSDLDEHKKRNRKAKFILAFFSAIILIIATYAWLSSALNVKIKFLRMSVASDSGLFISLNGIDFSDSVTVSMDTIINDLYATYPNHTNQWASGGLWPVSSNGIPNSNTYKFDVYTGHLIRTKAKNPNGSIKRLLTTVKNTEDTPSTNNSFISFDVFMQNKSGSPYPDNLYIDKSTAIAFAEDINPDIVEGMTGLLNSMRIGMVKIGSVPLDAPASTVQNVQCNNACQMLIYEPFHENHSQTSIEAAENYSIRLINGIYNPTYAIINEGEYLEHTNGHTGTGIPLITSHFAQQNTLKYEDFDRSIWPITNSITKFRVYIWVEGQDIDSLETYSKGAEIEMDLNFYKDLEGYR